MDYLTYYLTYYLNYLTRTSLKQVGKFILQNSDITIIMMKIAKFAKFVYIFKRQGVNFFLNIRILVGSPCYRSYLKGILRTRIIDDCCT